MALGFKVPTYLRILANDASEDDDDGLTFGVEDLILDDDDFLDDSFVDEVENLSEEGLPNISPSFGFMD